MHPRPRPIRHDPLPGLKEAQGKFGGEQVFGSSVADVRIILFNPVFAKCPAGAGDRLLTSTHPVPKRGQDMSVPFFRPLSVKCNYEVAYLQWAYSISESVETIS